MDIKLRARLTAYSKIGSTNELTPSIPDPAPESAGGILGVDQAGNYTVYPSVSTSEIDALFTEQKETTVSKEAIDELFESSTQEDVQPITHNQIDSLFKS